MQINRIHHVANVFGPLVNPRTGAAAVVGELVAAVDCDCEAPEESIEPRLPEKVIVHGENTSHVPFGFRLHLEITPAGPERRKRDAETVDQMSAIVAERRRFLRRRQAALRSQGPSAPYRFPPTESSGSSRPAKL